MLNAEYQGSENLYDGFSQMAYTTMNDDEYIFGLRI